jgi:hypothetical protein
VEFGGEGSALLVGGVGGQAGLAGAAGGIGGNIGGIGVGAVTPILLTST